MRIALGCMRSIYLVGGELLFKLPLVSGIDLGNVISTGTR
jgi:hypothetical protein